MKKLRPAIFLKTGLHCLPVNYVTFRLTIPYSRCLWTAVSEPNQPTFICSKFNNANLRKICEICFQSTIRKHNGVDNVIQASLL